jgi:hypothetical protein
MAIERLLDPDVLPADAFEDQFVTFMNAYVRPKDAKGS